ncbi:Anaphase-promoting complex subunit 2 [Cyanidiococcus yangmingshanensis]|uniref:Anaphase-promoting complex subunit 2 n=1 Tax=Cyanidiococcus yangmingshanensis TaxID=2690220 RepID=A0A7J7IFP0_9RHOD|nr:Anaphase-promoting complex subunit 2 [Cyanidiococcus yangmingshanensis]
MGTSHRCTIDLNREVGRTLAQFDEDMLVLGLFDLWRDLVSVQIYEAIEEQASKLAHGELCRSVATSMLTWVNRLIRPWLRAMQPDDVEQQPSSSSRPWYDDASSWEKRVLYFTHEALLHARLQDLFDIIVEFPASNPALVDIRECLEHTDAFEEITQSLCNQLERRLLHPGASTSDILHHSVNTIQSLLQIEPHGFLLSRASKRLHRYLSSNRPEAMACLVELFASPEGMSLFPTDSEQLVSFTKAMKRPSRHEMDADMDDTAEDPSDSDWEPDPINAPLTGSVSERRGQMARNFARLDVLSILMNVCGGRRRFIAEFHGFLAERLTSIMDYDFESLFRNLEILKVRLGPTCLSNAETILKDVSDSRRFSNFVRSQSETLSKSDMQIELLIISYLYWPCIFPENQAEERRGSHPASLAGPSLIGSDYFALLERHRYRLVPFLEHFLRTSEECFSRQKAPRVLRWIPALGICDLDLDFADGRHVHMQNVPLMNAMLIELFTQQPRFTLNELVEKLFDTKRGDGPDSVDGDCQRLRSSMVDRALRFWLRHAILRSVGNDLYEGH